MSDDSDLLLEVNDLKMLFSDPERSFAADDRLCEGC